MASKKSAPLSKRLSSFSHTVEAKNLNPVAKHAGQAKSTSIKGKKTTPSIGKPSGKSDGKAAGNKESTYSKEAEERFDDILEGNFNDVPPLPRSTVRIFLSSTFSDMRAERNALAKEAYPKLRDYCAELGISFQVVDLRWGLTAEATNSHVTTKICLLELKNCQKISLGPSCISLIGNRYGYCPLPYEVPPHEFDLLSKEAASLGVEGASMLDSWYLKDDNAVPSVFSLQPITSRLSNYLNEKPGEETKREADVQAWAQIEHKLIESIHKAALSCADKGTLSAERAHFYIMSVTEHEVKNGIEPAKHALAFLRELHGLDGYNLINDALANRHKEVVSHHNGLIKINKEIESLLNSLKNDISTTLNAENIRKYEVPWQAGGLNPDSVKSHHQYISQFCSDFIYGVQRLIDDDIQTSSSLIRQKEYYSDYGETLHHAHFCKMKCQSFCGQKETLERIKSYILDSTNRKPFVIHAHSGAGKTSIMAMAMESLRFWMQDKFTSVIRFLGTSPNSTNIYSVLFSICGQLADVTDSIMEPQAYKTMKSLQQYLPRFLRSISSALKMPVIIFLDSLDQLGPENDAYRVNWLPQTLPNNVKIIISTLPQEHGILKQLHSVIADSANIFEVPVMTDDTSHEIIDKYFALKNRCVTNDQMTLLLGMFRKAASPLYLKLLMDQAIAWKSYDKISTLKMPGSVKSSINLLFEQLEVKFGAKVVQAALGMITVGLNGLSEIELEDAISCVDEALVEIYKYHDPPVPGIIRVPPVLWARIRYDIKEYLVERQSQGVETLFWYHRQFIETAIERYATGDMGQRLHKILFEMYASEKGMKRDITLTQRNNLKIENADRCTTPQATSSRNIRKLECMSYHLKNSFKCIDRNLSLSASYCDLNFLHAKIVSIGAHKLLSEIQEFLKMAHSQEIKKILKLVSVSKNSLVNPVVLAFNILAYINTSTKDVNLNNLKSQAENYLLTQSKTMLIPSYACLAKRSGEPEKVYGNLSHLFGQCNEHCLLTDDWTEGTGHEQIELENTKTLTLLDLRTLDIMKFACENLNSKPYLSSDGQAIFYLSEAEMMLVKISVRNGTVNKYPLSEIFSSSIKVLANRISRGDCHIAGCHDGKLLAVSIHDRISVLGRKDMKKDYDFIAKDVQDFSNIHICLNSTVVLVGTFHEDGIPQPENIIQVWTNAPNVKQKMSLTTDIAIKVGASAVTDDGNYHICFGHKESDSKNRIILTNLKKFMTEEHIDIEDKIVSMKMCPSEHQAFFLVGYDRLMLLNFTTGKFVTTLEHRNPISVWAVNWEEESLLVCDQDGAVSVFNMEMEKLMVRKWTHSPISVTATFQDHILLLTNEKAKIWNIEEFFIEEKSDEGGVKGESKEGEHLRLEEDILSFVIADNNKEIITGHSKECKVWCLDTYFLLYKFDITVKATELLMALDSKVVVFDKNEQQVVVVAYKDKKIICNDFPTNIMCITLTKDRNKIVLVTSDSKPILYIYDFVTNFNSKKMCININFKCLAAEVFLTRSERYAVFMMKITEEDFKGIKKMWKFGNFSPQNHPYRFVAVDMTQESSTVMHSYRPLSKIPHLGVTIEPYRGNQMMVSTRRWVILWDIPTGKCDQGLSKVNRKTTMYRPDWLGGGQCVGDNDVVCMADNKLFVAVGSQDGYVFVYGADSGMPAAMRTPSAKHPSPVNLIDISHSSELLVSACTSGLLKLWLPQTGECIFSASVGTELQQLKFTHDGSKVIALTKAEKSHTIIFDVSNM